MPMQSSSLVVPSPGDMSSTVVTTLVAASVGLYLYYRRHSVEEGGLDRVRNLLQQQSILVDAQEGIRASPLHPDGQLRMFLYEDVSTAYEAFQRGWRLSGDKPCLGWRPSASSDYEWLSYNNVNEQIHNLGSALVRHLHLLPGSDTFVGLYGQNSKEWYISELSLCTQSMVMVPLYDTLGRDACSHIIQQVQMQLIFCESNAKLCTFLQEQTTETLRSVKHLVLFEKIEEATRQQLNSLHPNIQLHQLQELITLGGQDRAPVQLPKAEDLFTVCYTSGTTGSPKGVMITHANFICMVSQALAVLSKGSINFGPEDSYLSYLPLAHMFEQSAHVFLMMHGSRIGYYRGDIRTLLDDIAKLRPTFFCSVPRVLGRIYDKVMSQVNKNHFTALLFKWAMKAKMADMKEGVFRQDTIWDKLIFQKVRNSLGGRVRVILSASAPLSEDVMNLVRCVFSCHVFEAYGQTECTAAVTFTLPGEFESGIVGPPLPCNHIKLIDVPDMNLQWRRDGRGEICVRGPNCSAGYYKLPEKTQEVIDKDGWVHTGDIGLWTEKGSLKIVDRCKHIFKLSQGEYISPERIEQCLQQSPLVAQIFVDGNSFHAFCVAVVVVDPENVSKDLLNSPDKLKKEVLQSLTSTGRKCGLKGFEMVKNIYISPEPFSLENDLLTPTMKLKRPQLREYFAGAIKSLYEADQVAT